jgi:hypothetical protein
LKSQALLEREVSIFVLMRKGASMRLLGGTFSPEEVTLMTRVLKAAAEKLPRERRTPDEEAFLAAQILMCAAAGERDPDRLLAATITTTC